MRTISNILRVSVFLDVYFMLQLTILQYRIITEGIGVTIAILKISTVTAKEIKLYELYPCQNYTIDNQIQKLFQVGIV